MCRSTDAGLTLYSRLRSDSSTRLIVEPFELKLGGREELQGVVVQGAREPPPGFVASRGDVVEQMPARRVGVLEALLGDVEVFLSLLQPGSRTIAFLLDARDPLPKLPHVAVCLDGRRDRSGAARLARATGGAPARFRLRDPL